MATMECAWDKLGLRGLLLISMGVYPPAMEQQTFRSRHLAICSDQVKSYQVANKKFSAVLVAKETPCLSSSGLAACHGGSQSTFYCCAPATVRRHHCVCLCRHIPFLLYLLTCADGSFTMYIFSLHTLPLQKKN